MKLKTLIQTAAVATAFGVAGPAPVDAQTAWHFSEPEFARLLLNNVFGSTASKSKQRMEIRDAAADMCGAKVGCSPERGEELADETIAKWCKNGHWHDECPTSNKDRAKMFEDMRNTLGQ